MNGATIDQSKSHTSGTPFLLIIFGVLVAFLMTRGFLLLSSNVQSAITFLAFPLLVIGILVAFVYDNFLSILFYLLALGYVVSNNKVTSIILIAIISYFVIFSFSNRYEPVGFDLLDWLLLGSVTGAALASTMLHGLDLVHFQRFAEVILLPFLILLIIIKLPHNYEFEKKYPYIIFIAWALIGLGSLIFKLQHPLEERVSGYIQMSFTMIGYTSAAITPLAIYFSTRKNAHRINFLFLLLVMLAMLLTNTRMAILMTGIGFILNIRQTKKLFLFFVFLALLLAGIGIDMLFARFFNLAHTSFDVSTAARFVGWLASIELFKENWMLGIGFGEFRFAYLALARFPLIQLVHAHNLFINKALDFGIPGALLYMGFIIRAIARSLPLRFFKPSPRPSLFSLEGAIASGLGIFLLAGLTDAILNDVKWAVWFFSLLGCLFRLRNKRLSVTEDA